MLPSGLHTSEEAAFRRHFDSQGDRAGGRGPWERTTQDRLHWELPSTPQDSGQRPGVPMFLRWGHEQGSSLAEPLVHMGDEE